MTVNWDEPVWYERSTDGELLEVVRIGYLDGCPSTKVVKIPGLVKGCVYLVDGQNEYVNGLSGRLLNQKEPTFTVSNGSNWLSLGGGSCGSNCGNNLHTGLRRDRFRYREFGTANNYYMTNGTIVWWNMDVVAEY